jgi:hypothetical protein
VATVSQNNEVKTEGTVCSAAGETTHQNHDEVKELQELRKPISVSAAGLKISFSCRPKTKDRTQKA